MNCRVCGSNGWLNRELIKQPDKYEEWVGITNVKRCWRKCLGCGLWHHRRNYPLENLEKIYRDGYRHPDFRGETIKQTFIKTYLLPNNKSENTRRVEWLTKSSFGVPETMLDIGSGFGVFPYAMRNRGVKVTCTEENSDSIDLIRSLGIPCMHHIPYHSEFDAVSLVHVLEHIEEPVEFLKNLHGAMKSDGKLFIEVPDAVEFEKLPPFSDEFNSCHTHFYEVPTLYKTLGMANYNVTDIHREHYKERNLYRIMAVCQRGKA